MVKDNKREIKATDGVRRSLYFSPDDIELLKYADSRPINRNQYILKLIREDMERDPNAPKPTTAEVSVMDLNQMLSELKEIKDLIKSGKFVVSSDELNKEEEEQNIIKATDEILTGVNWDEIDDF